MTAKCEGSCSGLEEILESDNEVGLVNLFRDQPTDVEKINSLVNECIELGASNCLIALIRGDVCKMHPTFDSTKFPVSSNCVTALAYVAHSCPDAQVIDLMLTKCGGTSLVNVGCTIGLVHGLPIHFLLIKLSLVDPLFSWYRGTSIIKLIFLLSFPEMKPMMDSLRLLVKYTDSINEIAWSVLKNGGFRQFAALLMVAHEKVTAPFDTGLTIHHYISSEIDSFSEGKLDIEQEELKCIFMDAKALLAVFEMAGDDLSSYCASIQKSVRAEDVVKDISSLLLKNQVNVGCEDIYLADCCKECYFPQDSPFHRWRMEAYTGNNFTVKPVVHSIHLSKEMGTRPLTRDCMPIPKLARLQQRLYTTRACQAKRMSNSHALSAVTPFSRSLGYMCLKLINKVRFA